MTVYEGNIKPSSIEQATLESDLSAVRITEISSNQQMRASYSSTDGLPDYTGNAPKGLGTSTTGWLLKKFTYDGSRQCTLIQIAYDSWDNRASASFS